MTDTEVSAAAEAAIKTAQAIQKDIYDVLGADITLEQAMAVYGDVVRRYAEEVVVPSLTRLLLPIITVIDHSGADHSQEVRGLRQIPQDLSNVLQQQSVLHLARLLNETPASVIASQITAPTSAAEPAIGAHEVTTAVSAEIGNAELDPQTAATQGEPLETKEAPQQEEPAQS